MLCIQVTFQAVNDRAEISHENDINRRMRLISLSLSFIDLSAIRKRNELEKQHHGAGRMEKSQVNKIKRS